MEGKDIQKIELAYWLQCAYRFLKWGVLPFSGGGEDQPYIFWVVVNELEKHLSKKVETLKKGGELQMYEATISF